MIFWIVLLVVIPVCAITCTVFGSKFKEESVLFGIIAFTGIASIISLPVNTLVFSVETRNLDPSTAHSVKADLSDITADVITTNRSCTPDDDRVIKITGKTKDVTFWVPWGAPQDYQEIQVCL